MADNNRCAYSYTVKRGDSFYLIAHRHGVQLRDLLEANPDIPPSRLTVGDVLCIPCSEEVKKPACENTGSNGNGQTAGENQTAPEENGGEQNSGGNEGSGGAGFACPPNRRTVVQEGQTAGELQLRYALSYHTLKTANPETDLEHLKGGDVLCIPESNIACPLPSSVVLGDNDTLESIARTYNVPVAALLRVNPCLAPEDFRPGTAVRLPD